jgi:hypothetical protein
MSGGYSPLVMNPGEFKIQTESNGFQRPFYFGASQVPVSLMLKHSSFSGSGMILTSTEPTEKKPFHLPR